MSKMKEAFFGDDYAPNVRPTDPVTSHQAAHRAPLVRGNNRIAVLKAHAEHPNGLTDYELADIVGLQQNSAGKRRGELRDKGMIEETEIRRPAPTGSPAIVWRITQLGLATSRELSQRKL